ncbi:MAG: hypothetical protein ACMZ64_03300 [Oleiphilus sp.]
MIRLVWVFFFVLSGCVSTRDFSIEIEEVFPISYSDVVRITGRDYDWVERYSSGSYFKVEASIDKSFIEYVEMDDVNIRAIYRFCDFPADELFLGFSDPYSDGERVISLIYEGKSDSLVNANRALFDLIIFGSWIYDKNNDAVALHRSDFRQYNLLEKPQDICFYVRAAGMGYGVDSENVVIPKATFSPKAEER